MIPVMEQPEPANFDRDVRRPGQLFLRLTARPTNEQFKRQEHWKKALPELRTAYNNICAYCACWIPFDQGTADHFQPKSADPAQAYEWTNLRLAQEKLNNNKGDSMEVLDPFHIAVGWFALDLTSVLVKPNDNLTKILGRAVKKTIDILKLNSNTLVQLRYSVLRDYSDGLTQFGFLRRYYPFIAVELERQGMKESIKGTVR